MITPLPGHILIHVRNEQDSSTKKSVTQESYCDMLLWNTVK